MDIEFRNIVRQGWSRKRAQLVPPIPTEKLPPVFAVTEQGVNSFTRLDAEVDDLDRLVSFKASKVDFESAGTAITTQTVVGLCPDGFFTVTDRVDEKQGWILRLYNRDGRRQRGMNLRYSTFPGIIGIPGKRYLVFGDHPDDETPTYIIKTTSAATDIMSRGGSSSSGSGSGSRSSRGSGSGSSRGSNSSLDWEEAGDLRGIVAACFVWKKNLLFCVRKDTIECHKFNGSRFDFLGKKQLPNASQITANRFGDVIVSTMDYSDNNSGMFYQFAFREALGKFQFIRRSERLNYGMSSLTMPEDGLVAAATAYGLDHFVIITPRGDNLISMFSTGRDARGQNTVIGHSWLQPEGGTLVISRLGSDVIVKPIYRENPSRTINAIGEHDSVVLSKAITQKMHKDGAYEEDVGNVPLPVIVLGAFLEEETRLNVLAALREESKGRVDEEE